MFVVWSPRATSSPGPHARPRQHRGGSPTSPSLSLSLPLLQKETHSSDVGAACAMGTPVPRKRQPQNTGLVPDPFRAAQGTWTVRPHYRRESDRGS